MQSSTTPDPGYQWESDKLTEDTTNESQEVSPFPAGDHEAHINRRAQNIANTRQNKNIKDVTTFAIPSNTKFAIPSLNNIGDILRTRLF